MAALIKDMEEKVASQTLDTQPEMSLDKLRSASEKLVEEYQRLDEDNIREGGEAGAIVWSDVDELVMNVIKLIRDSFTEGLKTKQAGFFGKPSSSSNLLSLFSEISLKASFQEILELPTRVDPIFEADPIHMEYAWIIDALNDLSLPQYIQIIRDNPELAHKFYDADKSVLMSDKKAKELIEIVYLIEKVYFELEYQSYVDFIKSSKQSISSRKHSTDSINQSILSSLKLGDKSSGKLAASESKPEIQGNQRSSSVKSDPKPSTLPRRNSPLKQSISADDLQAKVDDGQKEVIVQSPLPEQALSSLTSSVESELDEEIFSDATSETCTTESSFYSSTTTLTTITSDRSEIVQAETSGAATTSSTISNDQGLFGIPFSGLMGYNTSILASAIGYIRHRALDARNSMQQSTEIPGDFETIDRVAEKEQNRLFCSADSIPLNICPIKGLGSQHFKCSSCKVPIGINDHEEARLCQVSGGYFCPDCHVGTLSYSPALILNNWDFTKVQVSKITYDQLSAQYRNELYDVEKINADLFSHVSNLQEIKKLRLQIVKYSDAFLNCQNESRLDLLKRVWPRDHLLETLNLYSVEDLLEVKSGRLLREMKDYRFLIKEHVLEVCQECSEYHNRRST